MKERYSIALQALETNDLIQLSMALNGAVREAINDGSLPHLDPAIQLICFQIALCGNGDIFDRDKYQNIYEYCETMRKGAPNYKVIGQQKPLPEVKPN